MAEMFNLKLIKKPKKNYYCYNCSQIITGKHLYMVAVVDGKFHYGRFHMKCSNIQDKLCTNNPDKSPKDCCENINECIKEYIIRETAGK